MQITRMLNKRSAVLVCVFAVVLIVAVSIYCTADPGLKEGQIYRVYRVLDGDTFSIKVRHKEYTVRMLGIDSPETVYPKKAPQCYGPEASAELKEMIFGREIMFEFSPGRELFDKYGRYLAYASLVEQSTAVSVNLHMLEQGFAREYTFGKPYSRQLEFREAERSARNEKRGLWSHCPAL